MIQPIGVIHSPFNDPENMPIQPKGAQNVIGQVELFPEFAAGLQDLAGFSHIYLIFRFHRAGRVALQVVPFMDDVAHGVFATRSPLRPNHIGLSIVELVAVQENLLTIKGVDVLDGTPLLDIKPYIARFDQIENSRSGWMQATDEEVTQKRSDNRFV